MSLFEQRPIIITGAASGIGRAIAQYLARQGAFVGIFDLNEAGAQETVEAITDSGGNAVAQRLDIADYKAAEKSIHEFQEVAGPLYGLVNNAGWDEAKNFIDTRPEFWQKIIDINLYGPLNMTHIACRHMIEQGVGRVVNIASDAGRVGSSGEAVYSAAKGGTIALMKTLGREFARQGITFNSVCPGPTDTPLLASFDASSGGKLAPALERSVPMRRLAQPEDFPQVVSMFLDPGSGYITGQTISVSGGLSMHG
ncbi:MAG: SDR family NAD(P)-dependent oxidoreductase [bacterium]